ncbi:MAG: DNA translocase FtsK 4TM domain-containing protein, partial [Anaerolineales bacterium]
NERKLDLLGVVMAFVGIFTILSLVSSTNSILTGGWTALLALGFGWGSYILPVALVLVGVWLVLRNIERIPPISAARITGIILLFIYILIALHWIAAPPDQAVQAATEGRGGGYVGSLFLRMLYNLLGGPGTFFALVAWLLIAIALTFDVSISEIFRRLAPVWHQMVRLWQIVIQRLSRKPAAPAPDAPPNLDGFTPLRRDPPPVTAEAGAPLPVTPPAAPVGPSAPMPWRLPSIKDILEPPAASSINEEYVEQRARLIEETLASFGAPAQVVEINRGPSITQFGVEPLFIETRQGRTRVRVSKIVSLADDLALALAAPRIRIQAPVPGRSYVGIEVPNEEMVRVGLREILETESYQRSKKPLSFALGRDVSGHPAVADLSSLPHLLIAGTTGSGKSVCVNSILTSLLLNNTPDDLRLILVDPKRVELTGYNGIPHLLAPVVVEVDRVIGALQWMTREMDKRYHEFAQIGARNILDYNARMKTQGGRKLPYLVIIIDELADLMMLAPDETERTITRLAQLARATGIHLILATQRPSVDVVTGLIKANFPARI